jgi:hypothetical protein
MNDDREEPNKRTVEQKGMNMNEQQTAPYNTQGPNKPITAIPLEAKTSDHQLSRPQIRPLQVWIIIALLALILATSAVSLVLQVVPTGMQGGADFVPNQSFPSDGQFPGEGQEFSRNPSETQG